MDALAGGALSGGVRRGWQLARQYGLRVRDGLPGRDRVCAREGRVGKGYATEALAAVIDIARGVDLVRLYALCHLENPASWRVLEKCGFAREGILRRHSVFPNLRTVGPCDVVCYGLVLK